MGLDHYKRNDLLLYSLVLVSLAIAITSLFLQFNLRSRASQAARGNIPNATYQGTFTGGTAYSNDLVPGNDDGAVFPDFIDPSEADGPCAAELKAWQEAAEGYNYYVSLSTTQQDTVAEWANLTQTTSDAYYDCKSRHRLNSGSDQ